MGRYAAIIIGLGCVKTIHTTLPETSSTTYPIFIEPGLLLEPDRWLPKNLNISTIVIITDHIVKKYYGSLLKNKLKAEGYSVLLLSFSAGEKHKNNKTKIWIEKKMLKHFCDRNTLCLALGGGVAGDLAGFVAATYMRGIAYIQIPTTLLAMVDSSVGGKTGINTAQGKNLIGAFWQPKAVVIDPKFLKTLPKKQIINGLFEIIKIFLIFDSNSFYDLEKNKEKILTFNKDNNKNILLENLIYKAIELKKNIILLDEKENHTRKLLNFGHTIGHALEKLSNYTLLHGEAIALGMLVEAKIAELLKLLSTEEYVRIQAILLYFGINPKALKKFSIQKIIQATYLDKKNQNGLVCYVLLKNIGEIYKTNQDIIHPVPNNIVAEAVEDLLFQKLKICHPSCA